jgi:putative glutamine amidotransferase
MTSVNHDPGPAIMSAHAIRVVPTSKLAAVIAGSSPLDDLVSITNTSALVVNSSHHQAIERPGKGLVISARCSEDGAIEALDGVEDGHFVLGVQWHPERSYDASALSRGLFRAFIHAAEAWHSRVPVETWAL